MTTKFTIVEEYPKESAGTFVGWNDFSSGYGTLWTGGIGPCLAITMYDKVRKMGALAHIGSEEMASGRFYQQNIVNALFKSLGGISGLTATLAGESRTDDKISGMVRKELEKLKIPIVGTDLGNTKIGRSVYLHCNTGEVEVYRYKEVPSDLNF
ncbi:MAG: hypothetical protein AABX64_01675 [Nanoarchaeota archaeon]